MLQTPTNNNNPNQSTDFVSGLKQWWHTCPLFTRFILFACAALCIFTHFNTKLPKSLVNKPQSIVNDYQVTRLIFSPFVFYTVFQAAIALIAYLPVSAQQEKENGTLKTIIDFFLKNLEISILFVAICYTIKSFYTNALYSEAYGLWSILFLQIVERCLQAPDETTAFFLPTFQLQNKYYPIALFVLFTLVSDALRIDMIAAALAAFINVKFLNAPYNEKFHHQKMVTWESNSAVAWLKTLPNFVSLTRESEPLIADQGREYDPYAPVGASTSPTKRKKSSGSSPNSPYGDNGLINVNEMKPANKGKTDKNEFGVDI